MTEINNIFTEGTSKSPQIDFNHLSGELILSGRSIPENAARVYEPLLIWVNEYIKNPRTTTNFRLNLDYFNTATTIWLTKLIRTLGKIENKECILLIHLYFDIDDFIDVDTDEVRDIVGLLVDNMGNVEISVGVKIYSTDSSGKIIKDSTILI